MAASKLFKSRKNQLQSDQSQSDLIPKQQSSLKLILPVRLAFRTTTRTVLEMRRLSTAKLMKKAAS